MYPLGSFMQALRTVVSVTVSLAATYLSLTPLCAQQPPQIGYMYPPVVVAGKTTNVQLGGFDLTPDVQWFVHHSQIQLDLQGDLGDYEHVPPPYWFGPRASTPARPIPREVPARLTVPADVPSGWVYWQVANANGSSKTGRFFVSHGEETLESRSRDLPQQISRLPVAISGRLSRLTEVDQYQWTATEEGLISVELMARRLGADFLGVLEVHDSTGQLIADHADTLGNDSQLSFTAQAGETYIIGVRDVDFRGDPAYVYRLEITAGPRIVATFPTTFHRENADELEVLHVEGLVTVTSHLPADVSEHRYRWLAEEGETWSLAAQSASLGGGLDPHLTLINPEGAVVMENDDLPGTTDAGMDFLVATTGAHTAIVRDLTSRVGARTDFYRLAIERMEPDFLLVVPQQLSLPLGGQAELTVQVHRTVESKLPDEIVVSVEGLPEGVELVGEWRIPPGQKEAKLKLQAADDSAVVARPITIRGTTTVEGQPMTRLAQAVAAGNLASAAPTERYMTQVMLAITMTPPFDLLLIDRERQREVHRGTTYRAEFEIVRHPGFEGELELRMAAQQARYRQGIRGSSVMVSPEATRAYYPCFMPEWLGTDLTRRMVVHGVARVQDPHGHERYLVKSSDSRITMIMEGALLKVATTPGVLEVLPGSVQEIPVQLTRSPKLPVPVSVRLEIPAELREHCSTETLKLPADQETGTIRIQFDSAPSTHGRWNLRLIATAMEDDQWEVISEVEVPILVENP
jgi:hypothetical protein